MTLFPGTEWLWDLAHGRYELYVEVTDEAGKQGALRQEINLDLLPPAFVGQLRHGAGRRKGG